MRGAASESTGGGVGERFECVASPSSALRAPSPLKGEGTPAHDSEGVDLERPADWGLRLSAEASDALPFSLEGRRWREAPDEGGVTGTKVQVGEATTARARSLRRSQTEAERRMWSLLRDRRLAGHKFRRQVPVGPYVADFACYEANLLIELDGSQHAGSIRDELRDAELRRRGFKILRFWNSELTDHPQAVLDAIWHAIQRRSA